MIQLLLYSLDKLKAAALVVCLIFVITSSKGQTVLLNEDFESAGQWTYSPASSPNYNTWIVTNAGCGITGSYALEIYDDFGVYCDYYQDDNSNNLITYKQFSSAGYNNLLLDFKWKCGGESGFDYGKVVWSNNGSTWNDLATQYQGQTSTQTVTDLALPAGMDDDATVYIGFRWINDGNTGVDPGFVVDDINITGVSINAVPNAPTLYNTGGTVQLCFNNSYIFDNTPTFRVSTTDPESEAVDFKIDIDDDPAFGTVNWTETFTNGGGHFASGATVELTCATLGGISSGTTYYVRCSAKDPLGSNSFGSYSSGTYSFTYKASGSADWFQTTTTQFQSNTLTSCSGVSNYIGGITETSTNATYNSGNGNIASTAGFSAACEYQLNVNVPAGYISKTDIAYSITTANSGYKSEQRSQVGTGGSWTATQSGIGTAGTQGYNITNQTIANGSHAGGNKTFTFQGYKTWATGGQDVCNTYNQYLVNNTWVTTVYYYPVADATSTLVDFNSFDGATGWNEITFNDDETGADVIYKVFYDLTGTPTIIPDGALAGNSSGFDTSPIDISGLNTGTYNKIYIVAYLTYTSQSPEVLDWTISVNYGDQDSDVDAPTSQIAAGNIPSTAINSGLAVDVFSFKIKDIGGDSKATKVTNIRITPGASNNIDWTDHVQGVTLDYNGAGVTIGAPTITDTYIDIPITSPNLDIANGEVTKEALIAIYLNTSNIVDNGVFQCMIDADVHNWTTGSNSSGFLSDFGIDISSNLHTIVVTATTLNFTTEPSATVCKNTNLATPPAATALDANGNTDLNFGNLVTISNAGALGMSNNTATPISGVATFTNLQFTTAGTAGLLTASAAGVSPDASATSVVVSEIPSAPVATAGSAASCDRITANWNASAGATTYYLDIDDTDNTFGSLVVNNLNVGNVTTYEKTGLNPSTTYYYRVRASNGCGTSGQSNTITYATTAIAIPVATAGSAASCDRITANWNASAGATTYYVDIDDTDNSFSSLIVNNLNVGNVTTYEKTGLNPTTTYYYRVRAGNSCGSSANSNSISYATTTMAVPVATAGSDAGCDRITANWNSASGATGYYLDVDDNSDFSSPLAGYNNLDVGNVTTKEVTGLTITTTYYYRVRAYSGCGTSSNSNDITYATAAGLTSPTTNDESRCGTGTLTLTASGSTGNYKWYDASVGGTLVASTAGFTTPSLSTTTSYWVLAHNGAGSGEIFNEDFSNISEWTANNNGNTCGWQLETNVRCPSAGTYLIADADACGSGTTCGGFLTRNSVDASAYTSLSLEFDQFWNWFEGTDVAKVQVSSSTSGGWQDVYTAPGYDVGACAPFDHQTIDVSAYIGTNFQVRLYNFSSYGFFWIVDNMVLSGTAAGAYCESSRVQADAIINNTPSTVTIASIAATVGDQIIFNGARYDTGEPIFAVSATSGSAFDNFDVELNTKHDFSGTSYTQSISGTYSSGTGYDITCDNLSPTLPTTSEAVYFVRIKASDGGSCASGWSHNSANQWVFVRASDNQGLNYTTEWQFDQGTGIATNYGNFISTSDNATATSDYQDDYLQIDEGSSNNPVTTAGDQALIEGSSWYSGASNNCITVGYYANGMNDIDYHGFRFQSADIPQGATILSASFKPYAHTGSGCGATVSTTRQMILKIRGVDFDNCSAWSSSTNSTTGSPRYRTRTTAGADWNIPSGASQQWSLGQLITTAPDITSVVQEIVDRGGYSAGNSVGLIVDHNSGAGDYWRYFATKSANPAYAATLQTTYTNFSNEYQLPDILLASFESDGGVVSWNELIFEDDLSGCGACDIDYQVHNASNDAVLVAYTRGSGSVIDISGAGTTSSIYVKLKVKRNNSPKLSKIIITTNNSIILPVELVEFKADCNGEKIVLEWSTASEENNDYFTIEKSSDSRDYTEVATISGAGNSNRLKTYVYTDKSDSFETIYYRLKQTDFDGANTYSYTVSTRCENPNLIDILSIKPVPADNYVDVLFRINESDNKIQVDLRDYLGRLHNSESFIASSKLATYKLDVSNLSEGIYFISILYKGRSYLERIVIQR